MTQGREGICFKRFKKQEFVGLGLALGPYDSGAIILLFSDEETEAPGDELKTKIPGLGVEEQGLRMTGCSSCFSVLGYVLLGADRRARAGHVKTAAGLLPSSRPVGN